jgi:hypothetical protein
VLKVQIFVQLDGLRDLERVELEKIVFEHLGEIHRQFVTFLQTRLDAFRQCANVRHSFVVLLRHIFFVRLLRQIYVFIHELRNECVKQLGVFFLVNVFIFEYLCGTEHTQPALFVARGLDCTKWFVGGERHRT